MRIIIDAMGGDKAPEEIITGVLSAASKTNDNFILVGNKSEILRCLEANSASGNQFEIVNAEQIITMDDDPLAAIQKKKDSSMVVALKLLADGRGDALVSAGNTGALFSGATLIVKRASGIKRAAIGVKIDKDKTIALICDNLSQIADAPFATDYLEYYKNNIYTVYEQNYICQKGTQTAAGLWAAKEAVSKALGTGFVGFTAKNIEIRHNESGTPQITFYNGAKTRSELIDVRTIYISISHEKEQAMAFAVIE